MENTYQIYNSSFGEVYTRTETPKAQINLLEGLDKSPSFAVKARKPLSLKLAKIFGIIGIAMLAIYFIPGILTQIKLSQADADKLTQAAQESSARTLPIYDASLPKTNRLVISSIGVNTDIGEATYDDYESALKKGVWRVSDFGEPDIQGAPIILAAHRFGYLAWTNSFRRQNSFYNLPKVKVGDVVTIVWEQREYTYAVYKTENGEEITDYSADLILYTCEDLNSPERIFVYTKLI